MIFEFLSDKNTAIAKRIIEESDFECEEFIRFWSEKEIQLDGNFSLQELKILVKVMEQFEPEKDNGEQ